LCSLAPQASRRTNAYRDSQSSWRLIACPAVRCSLQVSSVLGPVPPPEGPNRLTLATRFRPGPGRARVGQTATLCPFSGANLVERVKGIEPSSSAWKAVDDPVPHPARPHHPGPLARRAERLTRCVRATGLGSSLTVGLAPRQPCATCRLH
jgi:hypothetical protein